MLEHMRNHGALLRRVRTWLRDADSRMFVHIFSHIEHAYLFEDKSANDWCANLFTLCLSLIAGSGWRVRSSPAA